MKPMDWAMILALAALVVSLCMTYRDSEVAFLRSELEQCEAQE